MTPLGCEPTDGRLRPRITEHAYVQLRALAQAMRTEARLLGGARVLDLGCGAKPYRALFTGPYLGIDLAATHGSPDCLALAEVLPIREAAFDAALSTQQLEHVGEPRTVLAEARRVVRPGGYLMLSTHGVWVHHPDPHDLWRWTEEGLCRLIESSGFDVVRVHRQGELVAAAALLLIYPLAGLRRSKRKRVRWLAMTLIAIANGLTLAADRAVSRRLPRHYASPSYLVVARRR